MTLPLDGLDLLNTPDGLICGAPLQMSIDLIDEDPNQPRRDFDPAALAELAESVRSRGVLQAISVRRHPVTPDRWMVNFGARRLRASRLAGRPTIPAYVDNAMDSYDQVIENEQRESLSPLELAMFVQKKLQSGERSSEIARTLGKSRGYLTFVAALIDPPTWLLELYRSGRCRGISELYELRKLHEAQPAAVRRWIEGRAHVSRADVQAFKDSLVPVAQTGAVPVTATAHVDLSAQPASAASRSRDPSQRSGVIRPTDAIVVNLASQPASCAVVLLGEVNGEPVRVLLDAKFAEVNHVLVSSVGTARRWTVPALSIAGLRLEVLQNPEG